MKSFMRALAIAAALLVPGPALAQKYHDPGTATRAFALAHTHADMTRRHLGISGEDAQLFELDALFFLDLAQTGPFARECTRALPAPRFD